MDYSVPSRIVSHVVPNIDVSYYLGMLDENENLRKLINVTEYVTTETVPLTKNYSDGISNIDGIDLYFPIKKLTGDLDFLINDVIDITSHPFIVAYRDKILFNGYVKRYVESSPKGYDPDIIDIKLSIIHKSYDLKVGTGEIVSNGQQVESFIRSLIDNSDLNKIEIEVD